MAFELESSYILNEIIRLMGRTPGGAVDENAYRKLGRELDELAIASASGKEDLIIEEAVDVAYYGLKMILWAAYRANVRVNTLLRLMFVKYEIRIEIAKKKSPVAERRAMMRELERIKETDND